MKKRFPLWLAAALAAMGAAGAAGTDARVILERTLARDYQDLELIVHLVKVSATGKERPMDLDVKLKKTPEATRTLAVFTGPPEVAGISSLSWDYPGKPSERWFKLSGLEWVKCIGNGCANLEERFGFSMEIFAIKLDEANHTMLGEEVLDGVPVYKIESKSKDPANPAGARFVSYIDQEKFVARKIEVYDRNGKLTQESRFTAFRMVGSHWWETSGNLVNHVTGRGLRFEIRDSKANTGIPDSVFAKPKLFQSEGG
jgi:hypothetical protein